MTSFVECSGLNGHGSSLWDFHTEPSLDTMHSRIKEIYGVDVSDLASGNIAQILSRIAAKQAR